MPLDNRTCFIVNLRDRLACVSCNKRPQQAEGYHSGFEYHHLQPRSRGGADTPDNLVLLCRDCHLQQHPPARKRFGATISKGEAETFTAGPVPDEFVCHTCAGALNPQTVEMNCGWYRCDACQAQVHLFDHFYSSSQTQP